MENQCWPFSTCVLYLEGDKSLQAEVACSAGLTIVIHNVLPLLSEKKKAVVNEICIYCYLKVGSLLTFSLSLMCILTV